MAKLPLNRYPSRERRRAQTTARTPVNRAASPRPSKRTIGATERRAAIVAAGLEEFTAKGFAATRLDDVARRAGVAKGTIYLHFKDKDALFQELVRTALGPLIVRISNPPIGVGGGSARAAMEALAETFAREVIGTRRADIVRMIIAEGTRFPQLAEFYYREVIAHGIAGMGKLIEYGIARRNPQSQAGGVSATSGRADDCIRDLARAVRKARAARCHRDAACSSRSDFQ